MGLHRTFGALIPKISRNLDDVSSPKFKKIFERKLIKMATREDNLKKINDELKKLDDEQLEEIAGGDKSDKEINDSLK